MPALLTRCGNADLSETACMGLLRPCGFSGQAEPHPKKPESGRLSACVAGVAQELEHRRLDAFANASVDKVRPL